jgi:lipoprotein-anchoring transpeptidase ErfK/SrfK
MRPTGIARFLLAGSGGALALAAVFAAHAGAAPVSSDVFLLQGENMTAIGRQVPSQTVKASVQELLKGPTSAERKKDIRTQIPAATKLRSVSTKQGVATVDLTHAFVEGTNHASLTARLAQLVWTATSVPKITGVRLWIDGKQATSMGQGISAAGTLTRTNVDSPVASTKPPTGVVPDKQGPTTEGGMSTTWIQERLVALGYLPSNAVTGHYGPWTTAAVLAFQGWEKLIPRDGVAGPATTARLKTAKRPQPLPGSGKRIEVHLAAQVAFLVDGSKVTRVVKVSTGAPGYATPTGSYSIYRKHPMDWSYPYEVWLPYASYFNGGIAFHESPSVPAYPASHGCVRVPQDEAPGVYTFAAIGTPVKVVN